MWALTVHGPVQAQADHTEDFLPLTDDPTDPIGIDREAVAPKAAAASGERRLAPTQHNTRGQFGPEPPLLSVQTGEVIVAPASVREHTHLTYVELSEGLALVHTELAFENAGEKPAELVYRLAVPADAALLTLAVCNEQGCRNGLPDPSRGRFNAYDDAVQARPTSRTSGLPAGDARLLHDARGHAIVLRAAAVTRPHGLRIRIDYAAQTSAHAGVQRITLPAQGMDARTAARSVRIKAPGAHETRLNELPIADGQSFEVDAWSPLEISVMRETTAPRAQLWKTACGQQDCYYALASAPAEKPQATEIFLAIDASPSTEGSARSRLLTTISALLAQAPAGSRVRALRFAGRAAPLIDKASQARDLPLNRFSPVTFEAELGAATRFEAAWQLIEKSGFSEQQGRKLVIIVGDGGLTTGVARPFDVAKRKHVEVAVVNVADRASTSALVRGAQSTGGAVLDVGEEAGFALQSGRSDKLEERLAAVFQPSRGFLRVPRAPALELRAGDSLHWEGAGPAPTWSTRPLPASAPHAAWSAAVHAHAAQLTGHTQHAGLVAVDPADITHRVDRPADQDEAHPNAGCDRRGPAQRVAGLSSDAVPVMLAQERALCAIRVPDKKTASKSKLDDDDDDDEASAPGAGMPSSPLLSQLRLRIMPVARGCFRRDRAGRGDYQVRAVFEFELADREVVSAQILGKIEEPLRVCLLSAVDSLAVPPFTGRVIVRYPLFTERDPLPSQIELTPGTARELDHVTAGP